MESRLTVTRLDGSQPDAGCPDLGEITGVPLMIFSDFE